MDSDARKGTFAPAKPIPDIPITVFTSMDVYALTACNTCGAEKHARCTSKTGRQATNAHGTRVHIARNVQANKYLRGEIDAQGKPTQSPVAGIPGSET